MPCGGPPQRTMATTAAVAMEGAPVAVLTNNGSPNRILNAAYPGTHGPLLPTIRSGTSFSLSSLQSLPLLVLSLQPCTVESARPTGTFDETHPSVHCCNGIAVDAETDNETVASLFRDLSVSSGSLVGHTLSQVEW